MFVVSDEDNHRILWVVGTEEKERVNLDKKALTRV